MIKDKTLLEKLYENLRRHRGAFQKIAERAGCHRNWVRMVLKGDWPDAELVEVAADVLVELETTKGSAVLSATQKLSKALEIAESY